MKQRTAGASAEAGLGHTLSNAAGCAGCGASLRFAGSGGPGRAGRVDATVNRLDNIMRSAVDKGRKESLQTQQESDQIRSKERLWKLIMGYQLQITHVDWDKLGEMTYCTVPVQYTVQDTKP